MSDMITIRKGLMEISRIERSNLITAEPSHDGVVFTLKNGIQIYCTDQYMPIHTKDIIRNATNNFPAANLIFDLSNYNKPVLVELTGKK